MPAKKGVKRRIMTQYSYKGGFHGYNPRESWQLTLAEKEKLRLYRKAERARADRRSAAGKEGG